MAARDVVRQGRRALHRQMAVPALYIAVPGAQLHPCTVRIFDRFTTPGALAGQKGDATIQDIAPRLVFIVDDAPLIIRPKAVVSVEPGEAYRIVAVQPPHDITTTAEVTKLIAAEALGLPVP